MNLPDMVEQVATVIGHVVPERAREAFAVGSICDGQAVTVEVGQGIRTWLVIHDGEKDITLCLGHEQAALLGCAIKVAAGAGT